MSTVKSTARLLKAGYEWPTDKRKRRRAHRQAAKALMGMGTFLNPGRSPRGSTPHAVAQWHLQNARWL